MKRQIFIILLFALIATVLYADLSEAGFELDNIEQLGLTPFDFHVNSSELTIEDQAISFQFDLNYDAAEFSYDGYTAGANLPGMLVVNDLTPGTIMVAYAGAEIITGVNELITIHLIPAAACETVITMSDARYNNTEISNITGGSIIIEEIPELSVSIDDVVHQGLTPVGVSLYSNDIQAEDEILSYQFELELSYGMQYVGYSYDETLTGELIVNDTDPDILYIAYAGFDPIVGITELLTVNVVTAEYGDFPVGASNIAFNNFQLEGAATGNVTVYPAWDEVEIEVTGADVFTGDQFESDVLTSLIMPENEIVSFQFILNYDAELLEYAGLAATGERLAELVVNAEVPGVIQAAFASSDPIYGEGLVAGFLFNAIDEGATQISLEEFVYNNTYIENLVPGDVMIVNPNNLPIADAGEDFAINENTVGTLDGSGSYDPDDDAITYLWEGELELDDNTAIMPVFTAPDVRETTDYEMMLTVDDGEFATSDAVIVTVVNVPTPSDATVNIENYEGIVEEDFTIAVQTTPLAPEFGVISYQYIVNYDPEYLTYTGYEEGTGMPEGMLVVNGNEPGVLQVAFSSPDAIGSPAALNYFSFIPNMVGESQIGISEFYYNNYEVADMIGSIVTIHEPFYYVGVYAEDLTAGLDMEFTCNVMTEELLSEWNIISYQFHLYYDATMLQYTGYQLGDLPQGGNILAYEIEPGHLSVAFADYTALSGAGSLAGFNFIPLELGNTEVVIDEFKYNATYLPQADSGDIEIIIPYSAAIISAPELTVCGCHSFTVGINTTEMLAEWGVISFQFDLGFDAEMLEFTGYQNGSIISSGNLLAFENEAGNVSVAFADYMPIAGEGSLVELEFMAANELGQSELDISNFKYNSLYLEEENQVDGMVTLVEPYANAMISCSDAATREGLNFTVGISTSELMADWEVISFQFDLGFDPEYVDYVGYTTGEMITSGNLLAFENEEGNISIAFADYMPLAGEGELVELEFTALLAGDTTLDINDFKYNALYLNEDNLTNGEVFIDLGNYPPVAVAGADQVVEEGNEVQLNGLGSYDPDDFLRTPDWYINPPDYEYNGFIWGVVEVNGVQSDDVNDMIGVFAGEECRGIAQQSTNSVVDYAVPFGHVAFMPQVYSNVTSGETLTFKYYDASADVIYDVEGTLEWTADMVVGNGWDPYIFAVTAEAPPSDLIFNWLPPVEIELDDVTSPTPSFIAPWVEEDTEFIIGLEVSDGEAWSEIDEVSIMVIDHPLTDVVVSMPELVIEENTSVTVPLTTGILQPDMDVTTYQYMLYYDASLVTYTGYAAGELSPQTLVVNVLEPGTLFIAYAGSDIIVGEGELMSLDFYATEGGICPLDINNFEYNDTGISAVDGNLEIINVNDTPEFDLPETFDIDEDNELTVDFESYIEDPDNDTHTIIPVGNTEIMIGVAGYDVTISAPENWFGSEVVTFIVDDGASRATAVDIVTINFISVNDAPVMDVPPIMYFDEDGVMYFDVEPYVTDVENDELQLTVTGMEHLIADIDGLMATITAEENWYGEETLFFMVSDEFQRETAMDTCHFIIEPVNDPPTLELPSYASFNEDESLLFDVSPFAADVDMDELSIAGVDYDQTDLFYSIEGMEILFTASPDWYGVTEVTVAITDNVDRAIAESMITIEVLPVNDAPEMDLPENYAFNEDESLVVDFEPYIYDVDMDVLVLTAVQGTDIFAEVNGYEVTFTATENWFGVENISFTIDDMQGRLIAEDTVEITVLSVNDEPLITEFLPEETQMGFTDTTFVDFSIAIEDIEGDAEISWYINDQLLPGFSELQMPVTFDQNGEYTVKASISDEDFVNEIMWTIDVWMGPNWETVVYPSSTTAYTRITLDGLPVSELDMIGAFVDGEVRGWSHPIISQTDDLSYATVIVNGVAIEEIEFIMYDYSANEYYEIYETFTSNPGGDIGTPPDFIVLNYGSGDGPNWTPVIYTNSTIVYGIVQIEGMPADIGDRVGCFVGAECRATSDVIISDREVARVTLIVQGDTPEIAHFKVWDSSEDIVLTVPITIVTDPGDEIGYPPNEITINATESATITQSIDLSSGWNLISLNVYPSDYQISEIFAELIDNEELLKIKDIFNSYDPTLLPVYNTLTEFEDGNGYYVRVNDNTTLDVEGLAVNVQDTQIALNAGWNLKGYLPQVTQDLDVALDSIIDQLLKIKDSFGSYDPSLPPEFNTLSTMSPGNGYWIKMYSADTLIYPSGTRNTVNVTDLSCPIWQPVIYTNSTLAYGSANLNGLPAEGYIAAFAGDECRAAAPVNNGVLSLVINGTQAETITFKLYHDGVIYESNQTFTTNPGNDISDLDIDFRTGDIPIVTRLANIYPNPFNPETTISYQLSSDSPVNIAVYNIKGQKTATLVNTTQSAGDYQITWNADNQASGVYFLRFMANGKSETRKLILMK